MKADVIVVGAGPAGNIAAKTLAEKGVDVLVVERKQEIGPPKRCAEGLTLTTLDFLDIKPNPAWAANKIDGGIIYTPKGRAIELKLPGISGYILERKIFEKYLAVEAVKNGARYMVKAQAESVIMDAGKVTGIKVNHMGEIKDVEANIVIAADGVDSKIARSAGLASSNKLTDYHSGIQYEMAGVKCREDVLHFFLGDSVAPKGYAWIFPKGNTLANVGLGIMGVHSKDGGRARDFLDKFIESRPEYFAKASALEINAGGIPVSGGMHELVSDGLMVIGDAAQQVHPITGGGMTYAMKAAKIAAEVAADAVKKGDYSKKTLSSYEKTWNEKHGSNIKKLLKARSFFEKLDEDELEKISGLFSGEEVIRITNGDVGFVYPRILKKAPSLLSLAKKLI